MIIEDFAKYLKPYLKEHLLKDISIEQLMHNWFAEHLERDIQASHVTSIIHHEFKLIKLNNKYKNAIIAPLSSRARDLLRLMREYIVVMEERRQNKRELKY